MLDLVSFVRGASDAELAQMLDAMALRPANMFVGGELWVRATTTKAIEPDEDADDVYLDTDDELGSAYESGFEAGERDAREGSRTDNPFARDTSMTSFELWQDGYDDAGGALVSEEL